LTENIVIRTTLAPELWRVRVDPEQVVQVIVNLAVNARDAMPRGGRLTFASSNVDISPRDAHHHPGINPGRYVMLSVRDTGVGMDQTVQKYIFEPFFTTKGAGQGTGLGLATVHGIVKQHGGHIWVYSEPGMGTIFKVFFPESRDSVVEVKPEARPALSQGSGTILLVEDEPLVRNIAALTLRTAGYHVIEAADGDTAMRTAREMPRGPDVLVTDIVMPGISGTEVAESLTRLFPSLRTIFTSGYSEESALAQGTLGPRTAFLPKPYTLSSLTRAVQEILEPQQTAKHEP
jgi:two-component system, cell cycle sensor histidine kinase and response regulator CckA